MPQQWLKNRLKFNFYFFVTTSYLSIFSVLYSITAPFHLYCEGTRPMGEIYCTLDSAPLQSMIFSVQ